MSKYNIGANQNLYSLLRLLDTSDSEEITLNFLPESEVYKNALNLKTLKKLAEERGKSLTFEVANSKHKDYIDAVNGDYIEYSDEEINLEDNFSSAPSVPLMTKISGLFDKLKFNKPSKDQEFEIHDEEVGTLESEENEEGIDSIETPIKAKSSKKRKLIKAGVIALIVLTILGSTAYAFYWYVPTAEVNISVDTKGLIKLVDVTASLDQEEVSVEEQRIPAFSVEATETDSQTIPTTGKKQIGEVAKGEVRITNKTEEDIEIDKGTTLKLISSDKDNLSYVLTEDVEIKGYTKNDLDEKVFQSQIVEIEAVTFGDNYNLDNSEKFEVDDYDTGEVIAENEGDIDGGSSEEVNVVAQADLDALQKTLEEFMKEKVENGLSQRLVAGQVMQKSSIVFDIASAEYSHQLGEETDNLTLQMSMSGTVLAYDESSLDTLMGEIVKTVVPESFSLNGDDPDYEVAATDAGNGTDVNLQVKLTSSITPRLDEAKIKEDLAGMDLAQAQEYLNNLNDVLGFEIAVSPHLPGALLRMPQRPQNISIEVEN